MHKIIITLLVVVFVLAGIMGCSGKPEQGALNQEGKTNIAVTPWPASASLYIAQEKGYFRDEGLDVILNPYISGHLGLDAVLSGKEDLATSGDTPIARSILDGKPVAVVATVSKIDRAILIIARKDRGISASGDLRGRKIGVVRGTTADFYLQIYLTTSYIDPKNVQIVDLAAEHVIDALLNGEVDAVSTWAPHTLVLRDQLGSNAVIFSDPSIYKMTWNIVVTQEFARSNPERIKKLLRALIRANRFIKERPDESRAISAKYIGTDSPLYEREWQDYSFSVTLDDSLILNLEEQARWMARKEGISAQKPPNVVDFNYTEGLKAVQPESVRIAGK